jgi:hypothetical protein
MDNVTEHRDLLPTYRRPYCRGSSHLAGLLVSGSLPHRLLVQVTMFVALSASSAVPALS